MNKRGKSEEIIDEKLKKTTMLLIEGVKRGNSKVLEGCSVVIAYRTIGSGL